MNRPSEIVVLVEDRNQQRLVFRYLERVGYGGRVIRPVLAPAGKGSGERWVRDKYAEEVNAFRTRPARTWLVVAIDADTKGVEYRAQQLAQELAARGLRARGEGEAIAHLIPKRNIETWILCLTGEAVDEGTDYSRDGRIEERIPAAALALFDWSRPNAAPGENCILSIRAAIPELRRLE